MSVLDELKSKPWFPWAVGAGVIVFLFWLLFWSTPEPGPTRTTRNPKAKDQREGLYDLKIGSWQNRVDQDLEATKKQLAEMDLRQQEIRDQFKNIGDALSDLTFQMKAERESRLAAGRAALPFPSKKRGQWNYGDALCGEVFSDGASCQSKGRSPSCQTDLLPPRRLHGPLCSSYRRRCSGRRKTFSRPLALKEAFASPNSYQVPLKGCFALGKAEGNASSERADIQIVRMSCVLPDGKAFEQEIRGISSERMGNKGFRENWSTKRAEDRLRRCRRSRRRTRAGLRPAAGDNVVTDSGAVTSTVTGDALTFGLASGAQGAATEMQRYFQKQAERLFPVVEIDAGKNVTMVMLSGAKVPGSKR